MCRRELIDIDYLNRLGLLYACPITKRMYSLKIELQSAVYCKYREKYAQNLDFPDMDFRKRSCSV